MADPPLDAAASTAALRDRSPERLRLGFERLVQAESTAESVDRRDTMISLVPFFDCARRLGCDPLALLGPIADSGPEEFREAFETFVRRADVTIEEFGWSIVETADGPAYRFEWPSGRGESTGARSG